MKQSIVTTFNFLLTLLILVVFALPQYQGWQGLKSEVGQKMVELRTKQDYFQNLENLKQELLKYESQLAKVVSSLPADPFLPSLLDFFQTIASQENLVLKKIESGQKSLVLEKPRLEKKMVYLEVRAAYADFKKFIKTLENSSRMIRIESLAFSFPEKGGDVFQFNLTISVNYLPESAN